MAFERDIGAVALDDAFMREAPPAGGRFRENRTRPRRWGLRFALAAGGCVVVGMIAARGRGPDLLSPAGAPAATQISFSADDRLAPLLTFASPDGASAHAAYLARSRGGTGERWDILTSGDFDADGFFLRVALRSGRAGSPRSSLFVELAKQSAELGASVTHAAAPGFFTGERGPVEWAAMTLSSRGGERSCLGFRVARDGGLDLSGLACAAAPLDSAALDCLLARLSPTSAGIEAGLGPALKAEGAQKAACPRVRTAQE